MGPPVSFINFEAQVSLSGCDSVVFGVEETGNERVSCRTLSERGGLINNQGPSFKSLASSVSAPLFWTLELKLQLVPNPSDRRKSIAPFRSSFLSLDDSIPLESCGSA